MAKTLRKGGFAKVWRQIYESEVMRKPPHFREIWRYLFENAEYEDCTRQGKKIKRGQILTSYKDIAEALSWRVGKRIERYKKHHIDKAFRYFKRETMVATVKATGYIIVTVLKYNEYQTQERYESDNESDTESDTQGVVPYIEEVRRKNYGDLPFPKGFPIEKFADWEYARSKNKKNPKMTQVMRKSALTQILNAKARKNAFNGIGYNSVTELLEHARDNQWRGFSWLNSKLNTWENNQKRFQKQRDDTGRPQPKPFTPEMLR